MWWSWVLWLILVVEGSIQLSGRVVDPSGAVLPNFGIVFIDLETGKRFEARTDGKGQYSLRLVPGVYRAEMQEEFFSNGSRVMEHRLVLVRDSHQDLEFSFVPECKLSAEEVARFSRKKAVLLERFEPFGFGGFELTIHESGEIEYRSADYDRKGRFNKRWKLKSNVWERIHLRLQRAGFYEDEGCSVSGVNDAGGGSLIISDSVRIVKHAFEESLPSVLQYEKVVIEEAQLGKYVKSKATTQYIRERIP